MNLRRFLNHLQDFLTQAGIRRNAACQYDLLRFKFFNRLHRLFQQRVERRFLESVGKIFLVQFFALFIFPIDQLQDR